VGASNNDVLCLALASSAQLLIPCQGQQRDGRGYFPPKNCSLPAYKVKRRMVSIRLQRKKRIQYNLGRGGYKTKMAFASIAKSIEPTFLEKRHNWAKPSRGRWGSLTMPQRYDVSQKLSKFYRKQCQRVCLYTAA